MFEMGFEPQVWTPSLIVPPLSTHPPCPTCILSDLRGGELQVDPLFDSAQIQTFHLPSPLPLLYSDALHFRFHSLSFPRPRPSPSRTHADVSSQLLSSTPTQPHSHFTSVLRHSHDQVRSIVNWARPDRQTLMFSATFKRRIEVLSACKLVRSIVPSHKSLGPKAVAPLFLEQSAPQVPLVNKVLVLYVGHI
jgi:hypothetical protein